MSAESRPPSPKDMPPRKEREQPDQFVGLQVRFLLADSAALDPNKKLPAEAITKVPTFEERHYAPFQITTEQDSKNFWKEQVEAGEVADNLDAQYKLWSNNLVEGVTSLSEKKRQEVFNPIFESMGITKDKASQDFTHEDAKKLYDRYFTPTIQVSNPSDSSKPHISSGLKLFVKDILSVYRTSGGQNLDKITKDLEDIKGLAGIFGGEKTQEMVAQLILAEAKQENDPQFAQKADINRINNPTTQEKDILNHIAVLQPAEKESWIDNLPIMKKKYADEIMYQAVNERLMLTLADTGAGKSVGFPIIVAETLKPGEKMIVTQPQQNTAQNTPITIANARGWKLVEKIGWIHGGGSKFDRNKTDIVFMTERIALYQLINNDPWFKDVRHISMDEAHKKTIDFEILSGLVFREQKRREEAGEKPLTGSYLSATADKEAFQAYTGVEDVIEVEGRTFGVDVEFSKVPITNKKDTKEQATAKLIKAAAKKAIEITREKGPGDIAIAVAGKNEMKAVRALLEDQGLENVKIVDYHSGASDKAELEREAEEGIRRIIIGTNAMETGVTVKGLKYVINTGEKKEEMFDPITGMEYIRKVDQSQAECKQWAGRVGRTSHGYVYHLMTKDEFKSRQEYPTPAIQRSDLTQHILLLKSADIDIFDLDLPSGSPDESRVKAAEQTLQKLGALDAEGKVTKIGKRMAEIPTDFHIARAIVQAENERRGIEQMYAIAAIMEASQGKSVMRAPSEVKTKLGTLVDPTSDFVTYLNIWQKFIENKSDKKWAEENGLNSSALMHVWNNRKKLLERAENLKADKPASSEELGHYIFLGYQDRFMKWGAEKGTYMWERDKVGDVKMHMAGDSLVGLGNPEYVVSTANTPITDQDEYENKEYTTYSRGGPKKRTRREKVGTSRNSYISNIQKVKPEWFS